MAMNSQKFEQVKSAAEAVDVGVTQAIYPNAFMERWSQFEPYGVEMPKSAAERDALIAAAYDVARAKAAQYSANGGVRPSSQVARVVDMAKRAAYEQGVADEASAQQYDLSPAVDALRTMLSV